MTTSLSPFYPVSHVSGGRKYSEFDPGEIAPRLRAIKEHGVGSGRKVAGIQCNRRHGRRISNSE